MESLEANKKPNRKEGFSEETGTDDEVKKEESDNQKNALVVKAYRRREIVRLVSCMNATVGAESAENGLLRLKQNYQTAFKDLCLYSEVCTLLSEYSFRLSSRRFVQELFMDVDTSDLYAEPHRILKIGSNDGDKERYGNGKKASGNGHHPHLSCLTEVASEDALSPKQDILND